MSRKIKEEKIKNNNNQNKKNNRNNKLAFTLIELLAVIIILGVLMIIAIPSVTQYIQSARKDSYVKTAIQYITDGRNKVNSGKFPLYDTNTTYYIPISCMSLEKGGDSPFGEFEEAYVVVTYDGSGYDYYWTSRDSSNMGILLTYEGFLDVDNIQSGITNISTDIGIGEREDIIIIADDCKLENGTKKSSSENIDDTTIYEKNEYADDINKTENELPILVRMDRNKYFWQYRSQIKTITLEDKINVPENVFESWDVSSTTNGMVMAYLQVNAADSNYYDLYIQGDGRLYANPDSSYLFGYFWNLDKINNINVLNTSRVTNMAYMFSEAGYDSNVFTLDLGNNFDTSNVDNMEYLFESTGYNCENFTLNLGTKFNTSKVTDMYAMFRNTGSSSTNFTLDLGKKFDTSNVKSMTYMFSSTGYNSKNFTLNLGDKFDTSNATSMRYMFSNLGASNPNFTLNLGDKFDTSNVNQASFMFSNIASNNANFKLNFGNNFSMKNATDLSGMFYNCNNIKELDLSKFETTKATNMSHMFSGCGNLQKIYVSENFVMTNVSNSTEMFKGAYSVVGNNGTVYNRSYQDKTYARIDTASTPGYFSKK